jgi:hypothetical protein
MILGFKTKINDKPTYFVEKILRMFLNEYVVKIKGIADFIYNSSQNLNYKDVDDIFYKIEHKVKPKFHTIREDKADRWHAGVMIDFFINVHTKAMYRFAPSIPVVSTQTIEIIWFNKTRSLEPSKYAPKRFNYLDLIIDGRLLEINEVEKFAHNDGFDSLEDFFAYFNEDFTGKIIHWTDKRY